MRRLHPDHQSNPPGRKAFDGRGLILTVQVDDAEAVGEQLKAHSATIIHPLTDEDWGQHHFITRDPAGVVEQTKPAGGYW